MYLLSDISAGFTFFQTADYPVPAMPVVTSLPNLLNGPN